MGLRDELIQVAAVAVAIVEDLDNGKADSRTSERVLKLVADERYRQDQKWGKQHHDPAVWLAILAEEVGEAAAEADAITDWDETPAAHWRPTLLHLIASERRARSALGQAFGEDN